MSFFVSTRIAIPVILTVGFLGAGCVEISVDPDGPGPSRAAVDRVIDDWHDAAAAADEERYFSHFAPEAVFLGTDAGERWSIGEFRDYAHPHFSAGRGWTYVPSERHVMFGTEGKLAWFDEKLRSEKYGELRGTGVLRRTGGTWKLAHYNMTFTIPNEAAADVVARIRGTTETDE